jgi:hypothetical protein
LRFIRIGPDVARRPIRGLLCCGEQRWQRDYSVSIGYLLDDDIAAVRRQAHLPQCVVGGAKKSGTEVDVHDTALHDQVPLR